MSKRSVSKKRQHKQWYNILAPEQFDRVKLGATPADNPEKLIGRTIETTLGTISGNPNQNHIKLKFRVIEASADSAHTELIKHEISSDYLRSLIRKGASKIDLIMTVLTSDSYQVRIHPLAFTNKGVDHSQEKAVRKQMQSILLSKSSTQTYSELMGDISEGRLSLDIYNETKHIYPLRRVEIQKATLENHPAA
jgi:small subunit ribosomal protein S3Ae